MNSKGIPLPFTDLLNSLLMNMGLSGRGLEGRLACVQVVRQSGNQQNARYPSNKVRWHIDSRCWPGGGLVAVSSHISCPGALRTISFRHKMTLEKVHIHMAVGGAYFMGRNLFAKLKTEYEHQVVAHLAPGDSSIVLLYRFWPAADEKDDD